MSPTAPPATPAPQHGELHCALPADSRVLVIGLGGIGCAAIPYLALFLQSLSLHAPLRLLLVDGDSFEYGNSNRMQFSRLGNKAEVKATEIIELLDDAAVAVVAIPEYVTPENVGRLIRDGDYVFLFVDNHPTRKLVSDYCQTLRDVTLISGGNEGVDPPRERGTYGNVQIAVRQGGADRSVPITRYHPEIAHPTGTLPTEVDCGQLALSVPQILFANLTAATAALNLFFTFTCRQLRHQEVTFDILEGRMVPQLPLPPGHILEPLHSNVSPTT
jgi:hypothetical protein